MIRSIACLLATFAVSTPVPAQPAAGPCPSASGGICASGESPVNLQPPPKTVENPGYLVAIDRRSLRADAADGKRLDNDNASTTPQKAEPVPALNPGWRSDFRAAPGGAQATVPARFTTDRHSSAGLQSRPIKDPQPGVEAKRHSAAWLEFLPEGHAGWALVIGLLVVALRRVPIRFRSNGL
ncbi:MAG: hypothetical protein ACT4PS_06180 [Betaproteobacteria bacterium]